MGFSDSNRILNNLITDSPGRGFEIRNSNYNVISDNIFWNMTTYGIDLHPGSGNIISRNVFSGAEMCIDYQGSSGIIDNNTFANNSVSSNIAARSTNGIHLENAGGNNLTNNTITNFTYNFGVVGEEYYDFVEDIDLQNTVDGRKIYYFVGTGGFAVNPEGGYYGFVGCYNVTLSDVETIEHNLQAYLLAHSHHINLTNISAFNTSYGVQSYKSNRNVVANAIFYRNHHAIYLDNTDNTTISNISSSENYGTEPRTGVYLYESFHNLITNNTTVSSNRPGIRLDYSYYNTISYCNLTKNVVGGIVIRYGGSNNISRCSMTENEHGVYLMGSPWNNITNNTINNNTKGVWISVSFSKNNLVANNEIAGSSDYGVLLAADDNTVFQNNITNNTGYAVEVNGFDGNWIHHNNMFFNKGILIKSSDQNNMFFNKGILIKSSDQNNVSNNYILNSSGNGVQIEIGANNILSYNNISGSGGDGIIISDALAANNKVTYNNITCNTLHGLNVTSNGGVNEVHHNNFICNVYCAFGYQGNDSYAAVPHFWDYMNVGNYWTNASWILNPGSPAQYYVDPRPMTIGFVSDRFPIIMAVQTAGPDW